MDEPRVFSYLELERMIDFSECKTNKDVYHVLDDCIHDINIMYWYDTVDPALKDVSIDDLIELLYRLISLALNDHISTDELKEICVNRLNEFVAKKMGV